MDRTDLGHEVMEEHGYKQDCKGIVRVGGVVFSMFIFYWVKL